MTSPSARTKRNVPMGLVDCEDVARGAVRRLIGRLDVVMGHEVVARVDELEKGRHVRRELTFFFH